MPQIPPGGQLGGSGSVHTDSSSGAHPGNDYYVQPVTRTIQRQANPILAQGLKNTGWQGPFTWAQAQAFLHHTKTVPSVVPGLSGIDEIGAVAKATFTALTDWHFWASLGWIVLGIVLAIMGLRLWLGKTGSPLFVPVPV